MKEGVTHLKNAIQKNFLELCLRRNLLTSEITSIAKKIIRKHHGMERNEWIKSEEQRIMMIQIKLRKEHVMAQGRWHTESTELKENEEMDIIK